MKYKYTIEDRIKKTLSQFFLTKIAKYIKDFLVTVNA